MSGASEAETTIVVDDDEMVRSFLSRALEATGLIVIPAATGRAALEAVRSGGSHLLFADGLLPDMHGLDLLRQVVAEPAGQSMALCLFSGTVRRAIPIRDGISALAKPVRLSALAEHVAAMRAWSGSPLAARLAAIDGLRAEILVDP